MGAFNSLTSIVSLLLLWLLGLSELFVFPPALFFIGLELVSGLVLGEVRIKVCDLLVAQLPKILICLHQLLFVYWNDSTFILANDADADASFSHSINLPLV
jgi:hypothetical protein